MLSQTGGAPKLHERRGGIPARRLYKNLANFTQIYEVDIDFFDKKMVTVVLSREEGAASDRVAFFKF